MSLVSPRQLRDDLNEEDRQSRAASITEPIETNQNLHGVFGRGIERSSIEKPPAIMNGEVLLPDS